MAANTQENSDAEKKWNNFVEIGNSILENKSHAYRNIMAKEAFFIYKQFSESYVHHKTDERMSQFIKLFNRIGAYLDADEEAMQIAVTNHFLFLHGKAGLAKHEWKDIKWYPKESGIQAGFSCVVYDDTSMATRYYVKTHQFGPGCSENCVVGNPDLKEVFIYKLLQHIGIGPEADFAISTDGSKRNLYIVTKNAGIVLLKELDSATASKSALLQMDLISRILCLRDVATNRNNCGQVDGKPMIIDFRIETQREYSKPDILERFYSDNGEFTYSGLMKAAMMESNDVKLGLLKQSMDEWHLTSSIEKAQTDVRIFMLEARDRIAFDNDLAKYIEGITKTINILQGAV